MERDAIFLLVLMVVGQYVFVKTQYRFEKALDDECLANHTIRRFPMEYISRCFLECVQTCLCEAFQIFNYTVCELLSSTRLEMPSSLKKTPGCSYYDMFPVEVPQYENQCAPIRIKTCIMHVSCSAMKANDPQLTSGWYKIQPRSRTSLSVFCDMTSKIGVTKIGHDSEQRTVVDGFEDSGSYSRKIVYQGILDDIIALINLSQHCEQFIKWECYSATLLRDGDSWWVSRQGAKMKYWGGATGHNGKCACGLTNSCEGGGNCNCAANDAVWRTDEGYLTDKATLPVSELRFGDTGYTYVDEKGYHTLGKLSCWG